MPFHYISAGRLFRTQTLENNRQCVPTALLPQCYYRNEQTDRAAFLLCFSDDIAWVKENLPLPQAVFIDWNKGTESWQDMMLMSHCRHHIICNSTFSWWGRG